MKGVTLIELLITVGILAVVAVIGALSLSSYRERQKLELEGRELATILRDVQNRSLSQESGTPWGIRFVNATSGTYTYQIFSGSSYASGTIVESQALSTGISFSEPYASSTYDITFPALTGRHSASKIVSFVAGTGNLLVGDIIVNKSGMINSRLETGVVGYWHFDEATSTTAYDASGNGNNGTLTNGPTRQSSSSCKIGSCLSFNGTNSYVNIVDAAVLDPAAITVTAWIKLNSTSGYPTVISKQAATSWISPYSTYNLRVNSVDNKFEFCANNYGNGATESATAPQTGVWAFLAGTYDGQYEKIYVNGILEDTTAKSGDNPDSSYNLAIGSHGTGSNTGEFFRGLIDDVRIYNHAISSTEISALYNDLK